MHALSCIPHTLDVALHDVATSPDGYVAAVGKLTFKAPNKKDRLGGTQPEIAVNPQSSKIPARLSGKVLTKSGFSKPFKTDLTLNLECFGPWCADATSGKQVLVFLRQTQKGYDLSVTPCGGHLFYTPRAADLRQVERCYLQGDCPKHP